MGLTDSIHLVSRYMYEYARCRDPDKALGANSWAVTDVGPTELTKREPLIPGTRTRYLADIAQQGRGLRERIEAQVEAARRAFGMFEALKTLHDAQLPGELERFPDAALTDATADGTKRELRAAYNKAQRLTERRKMMQSWADYLDGLRANAEADAPAHY